MFEMLTTLHQNSRKQQGNFCCNSAGGGGDGGGVGVVGRGAIHSAGFLKTLNIVFAYLNNPFLYAT